MKNTVVLLGAGGHASDLLCALESRSFCEKQLFVADDAEVQRERFAGRACVLPGSLEDAVNEEAQFLAAIGYPASRRSVVERFSSFGLRWVSGIVHKAATVHRTVEVDAGCVVLGQTWVSARVVFGSHTQVGYGVSIGHDTTIGSFTSVMPGATISGDCTIDDGVLIGAGATILQGLKVGAGATVGAGAVVVNDVEPHSVVVGVPAKELRRI